MNDDVHLISPHVLLAARPTSRPSMPRYHTQTVLPTTQTKYILFQPTTDKGWVLWVLRCVCFFIFISTALILQISFFWQLFTSCSCKHPNCPSYLINPIQSLLKIKIALIFSAVFLMRAAYHLTLLGSPRQSKIQVELFQRGNPQNRSSVSMDWPFPRHKGRATKLNHRTRVSLTGLL